MKYAKLYTEIARSLANTSKAGRAKVGALLLKNGRIISTGYNGQISGQPHEAIMQDGHDISTIHAEQNALMFACKQGIQTDGCEMFVTHSPCQICTKLMIQAGIRKVWFLEPYRIEENPFVDLLDMEMVNDG